MSDRIWHKGPPPHVGWWNASRSYDESMWRWWDGEVWSLPCGVPTCGVPTCGGSVDAVAQSPAPELFSSAQRIQWTDYWPADARVPRLDPTDGHWTFNTGERPKGQVLVEVAYRTGRTTKWRAGAFDWSIEDRGYDIVAWRPAE